MTEIFLYSLFISLRVMTVYMLFQEGMLLSFIRVAAANGIDKLGLKTSRFIQKPLWDCFTCMSSVWSIGWMLFDGYPLFCREAVDVIFIVCAFNYIISTLLLHDD